MTARRGTRRVGRLVIGRRYGLAMLVAAPAGVLLAGHATHSVFGGAVSGVPSVELLLRFAVAAIEVSAVWQARNESVACFLGVTITAAVLAAVTTAAALIVGAATFWLAWAVAVDGNVRAVALAWLALGYPLVAMLRQAWRLVTR